MIRPFDTGTCPNGWSCADIGSPGVTGTQSLSNGTWTVAGAGDVPCCNWYNTADAFHYVWQPLSGDGSVSARLVSQSGGTGDARDGLMIRQSTDPSAPYVFITQWSNSYGLTIQYRSTPGGGTGRLGIAFSATFPVYLGIGRVGNAFTFYTSSDGSTWAPINQSTITVIMTGTVLAGMAVSSASSSALSTDTFDNVSVSTAALTPVPNTCPSAWSCGDIGLVWPGTQTQSGPATYTVSGAGDLPCCNGYNTTDAFHYVWQPLSGDGTVSGRLVSQSGGTGDARMGLMIRQSTDPGSPYVYIAQWWNSYGLTIQYRSTQGGGTSRLSIAFSAPFPVYVGISRTGNAFTFYTSNGGNTWTPINQSTITVSMTGTVLAGMAVSSANTGALSTDTFDQVNVTASPFTLTPSTCPSAWNCADIGLVWPGTQAQTGATTYTVAGAGDLPCCNGYNTSDAFHYVWQPLSGDGSISARLVSQSGGTGDARDGLMIRQSTDPGSPYVYIAQWWNNYGLTIQYRSTQGGGTSRLSVSFNTSFPVYVGIGRVGNTFTFYTSNDGKAWTPINQSTITVTMTGTVLVGMAVSSANTGVLSTDTFDTVSVSASPLPLAPTTCPNTWMCADIGLVWPGTQSLSNGTWTVAGAGDVPCCNWYNSSDAFHYVWQTLDGDGSISTHLGSRSGGTGDARAGLMIRQSADPSAPYVFFTPWWNGNGLVLQYRSTQGGGTARTATVPYPLPPYIKVARVGNTFTAYTSSDGVTWALVAGSSVTVPMTGPVLVGLAVSSASTGALSTAMFDSVTGTNVQPTSGGALPYHPHKSVAFSSGLDASVDLADGHLVLHAADLSMPARGPDLPLDHTYDSLLAQQGITSTAGQGWLTSLTPGIGGALTGTVSFTDASGAVWPFVYTGSPTATAPYTSYTPPPGYPWLLTTSSSGYTLTNQLSGEMLTFNAQGQYLSDADAYGNANTLAYGATGPTTVTNSGGRLIALSYSNGLLSEAKSYNWLKSNGSSGRHVTYAYNAAQQLTGLSWGVGSSDAITATFGYSGSQLVTLTTPAQQAWQIGYDPQGRVSSLTSPVSGTLGQAGYTPAYTTTFTYSPGQTIVVEGAGTTGALTTTYTLDSQGEATAVSDGLGDTTRTSYDQDHDVLTSQDADGNTTSYAYQYSGPNNTLGLVTQTVRAPIAALYPTAALLPVTTTNVYDPNTHDLTGTTTGNGGLTLYGYDGHHGVITTTQLLATSVTGSGCPTSAAHPVTAQGIRLTTAPGDRRAALSPLRAPAPLLPPGCQFLYTWRASVTLRDGYGEITGTVDGRGLDVAPTHDLNPQPQPNALFTAVMQHRAYRGLGDLISASTPSVTTTLNGVTSYGPVTTTYGYNYDGDQTNVTSANGATTSQSYNHLGQDVKTTAPPVHLWNGAPGSVVTPTETTSFDPDGNVVKQVDANGVAIVSSDDPLGRLVASTNGMGATTLYTYSATAQTVVQDPRGQLTQNQDDAAGRLTQTIDPNGARTQYQDDPAGNTLVVTSTDASGTALQIDTRQYDAWNRVITDTVSGPGSAPQQTVTSYDQDGNVAQVLQPDGDATSTSYDLADEATDTWVLPATLNPSGLLDTQTTYDAAGQVSSVQDGDGRLTLPVYDNAGRTIGSTATYANATTLTSTVQLDPDGNVVSQVGLTQTVGQNGQVQTQAYTTTTGYNAADWAVTSTDVLTTGQPLVTAYGYDAAGQQRTQSIVSGTIPLTTTLDNAGRATSIVEGISGSGPYTTSYGYTLDDQPVSMTLPGSVQQGWGYDGDGRLLTQTLAGPTGVSTPLTSTYGYSYTPAGWTDGVTSTLSGITTTQLITHDAQGRLTAASGGGTSQSWSYDGNGNLLSAVITTTGGTTTTTYGYTQAITPNAVLTLTTPGQPATYYGYDQHGDTISITNGGTLSTAIQYDGQARPITITLQDGTQATLGYNADGLRASYSVTKGGTTSLSERFQYRDGELAQAIVVSGTQGYTDTYVYAPSGAPLELLRTTSTGTTSRYWYQVDGRGNVVALTDSSGNVVDRYSYDLWGALTSSSEQVPQQLRYGGYWWDAALGWYWVSVRYYDPALTRWLQPDPSEQDGVHTYAYVDDYPADETDPSGLVSGGGCYGSCWTQLQRNQRKEHKDPCNVFFFGYFCGRNQEERERRAQEYATFGGAQVTLIFFAKGPPAPDEVVNARTTNPKGDWAEEQAIARLQEVGYMDIGAHPYQGIDAVLERRVARMPGTATWTKYALIESKFADTDLSDKQELLSWYYKNLPKSISDPAKLNEIRELLLAGRVQVLVARTYADGTTTVEELNVIQDIVIEGDAAAGGDGGGE